MTKFFWLVLWLFTLGRAAPTPRRLFTKAKPSASSSARRREIFTIFWARLIVEHMGKHIPGNPSFIVQNMPGAGHVVAVNYLYTEVKPDGLTIIGSVIPSLYLNQLHRPLGDPVRLVEVQLDRLAGARQSQMYMRADSPYKTIEDVRTAKEPPKCGATGVTGPDSYLPKLLQETVGAKFQIVTGYPGGTDIDLGVERGEIHCRAFTIEAFFGREPYHTWRKTNFVHHMFQSGKQARRPPAANADDFRDHGPIQNIGRRAAD